MKQTKKARTPGPTASTADTDAVYTLDVLCELVGVSSKTILHYQEHGLIIPARSGRPGSMRFDDETLRTLRRIEHLRARYEMNLPSLNFTLGLLRELERLRDDLRSQR